MLQTHHENQKSKSQKEKVSGDNELSPGTKPYLDGTYSENSSAQ